MGRRITRQISGMHSIRAVESHEIMHRRRDKFSAASDVHVRIGIGYDGVAVRIDNFPIHTRIVTPFLLQNFE